MGVSKNNGTPKSSMKVHRVFHYFHHPFWGFSPYFWKHPYILLNDLVMIMLLFIKTILHHGNTNRINSNDFLSIAHESLGNHIVGNPEKLYPMSVNPKVLQNETDLTANPYHCRFFFSKNY